MTTGFPPTTQPHAPLGRFLLRLGMPGSLLLITFMAIASAHLICATTATILHTHASRADLIIATAAPAIVAPALASFILRMLFDIEAMRQQLEHASRTDALTGICNRGHFQTLLDAACASAAVDGEPLSVAIIDIDHFKRVNDTLGHAAGDDVIRATATRCLAMLRDADVIGRIGGEEFAIILPHTDIAGAEHVIQRIRTQIGVTPIATAAADVAITVSGGVAQWRPGDNAVDLMRHADKRLYLAKDGGRDRIVAAAA